MQIRQLTQRLGRSSQRLAAIVAATSLLALAVSQGAAQTTTDACPALVRTALDATENFCRGTGRNQICYGHSLLEVEPQPAVEDLAFEKQGDVVDALLMRALRVSAMNISNGYWGVALMRLQANLPDTLPGQNVTFLLFGDVEFTSAPAPSRTTSAIANQTLTIRTGPSTDNLPMHYLEVGEGVVATGRLTDGSWLRVRIPGEVSRDGWVVASLLTPVLGNFDDLDLVNPIDAPPSYGPLQAFYLKTGASQPECAEMPTSGLLIQTPSGAHDVSLVINDVEMRLGSTVFVQASPGKSMSVMTLEGMAHVSHEGEEQVAAPGAVVEIPVNESMHASGPPSRSKPYDSAAARALPVQVLDEPVIVPPPLPTEAVERINDLVEQGRPLCGVAGLPACGAGTALPASATPTASQPPVEVTAAALPTGTAVETTEEPTTTATVTVTVTPAPSATPETTTAPTLPPVPSGTTAPSGSSLATPTTPTSATPTTPTPTVGIIIASTPTPWATPTSTTTPGTPTRAATTTGIVATTTQTAGPLAASDAAATATPATSLTRAATTTSIVATSTPTPTPTPTTEIATI